MLRRSLPVAAVTAAAFALVPGSASATPAQAAVEHYFSSGYYATADFTLPDGRTASASLAENRSATGNEWRASSACR